MIYNHTYLYMYIIYNIGDIYAMLYTCHKMTKLSYIIKLGLLWMVLYVRVSSLRIHPSVCNMQVLLSTTALFQYIHYDNWLRSSSREVISFHDTVDSSTELSKNPDAQAISKTTYITICGANNPDICILFLSFQGSANAQSSLKAKAPIV